MNCRDESPGLSEDLPGRAVTDVDSTVVRKIQTSVVEKELGQNSLVTQYVLKVDRDLSITCGRGNVHHELFPDFHRS